ncbi:MAG: nicotinamide mononucleotide transporter [Desulfurivibrionaceae bacterium]
MGAVFPFSYNNRQNSSAAAAKDVSMYEWILTGLSILGTLYNLQKRAAGWVIWTIANLGWIISFSHKGMMAEAFLFSVYLVLSVYGIFKWWTPRPAEDKG